MQINDNRGPEVTVMQGEGVLRIGLNRPEKLNALTGKMYAAMAAALGRAEQDGSVRVILIHGSDVCFTSGNDLGDFADSPPTGEGSPVFDFLTAIRTAQKPIVAAVSGPAVGVGTTMLLHCDLVYAGRSARFRTPFVSLGLCPEAASSLLLPQLVGHQRACEMLLLGETIDAERAHGMGLVNAVCPDRKALQHALAAAQRLAAQPPAAVRLAKALLKQAGKAAVAETMAAEGRLFVERLSSPEAAEALKAFFEKRPADFSACA